VRFALHVLISALLISAAVYLSRRYPRGAGFLIALPLATMIALPLSYLEHAQLESITTVARSIAIAVPLVLFFLAPLAFGERLSLSFWQAYAIACLSLAPGFAIHRWLTQWI
jgi:hypothetical protein